MNGPTEKELKEVEEFYNKLTKKELKELYKKHTEKELYEMYGIGLGNFEDVDFTEDVDDFELQLKYLLESFGVGVPYPEEAVILMRFMENKKKVERIPKEVLNEMF